MLSHNCLILDYTNILIEVTVEINPHCSITFSFFAIMVMVSSDVMERDYFVGDCDFFILFFTYTIIMAVLNIEVLQEIVEKLPKDFTVEFEDREGVACQLSDDISVKVSEKKLVFRKY